MKKIILIGLTIIMFFFKSSAIANYDKIFFDLNIEGISGEVINFAEYKNKVILIVNTASLLWIYKSIQGFTKSVG